MKKKKRRQIKGAMMPSREDPFGSYTGVDLYGRRELPVQDADDL